MNHSALFTKLMDRLILVQVLSFFRKLVCNVFVMCQMGFCIIAFLWVEDRHLFSIFIDDLVKYVNKANVGCRIHAICTAIFLYADDVILLAPSVFALQSLVDICASDLEFLDMAINVKKSACLHFGSRCRNVCCALAVSGHFIKWVESARYLGVYLASSTNFKCSFSHNKAGFWRHLIVFMENRPQRFRRGYFSVN